MHRLLTHKYSRYVFLAIALALLLVLCGCFDEAEPVEGSGTDRMVAELAEIHREASRDPGPYFHLNLRRAQQWLDQAERTDGTQHLVAKYNYVLELLNAGETQTALSELERLIATSGRGSEVLTPESKPLYELLAIGYFRLAEDQNRRLGQNNAHLSIMPTPSGAGYIEQDAARKAIAVYEEMLQFFPGDLQSRWLLNLAHMALGEYPEALSPELLIPGLEADPASPITRFPNVARRLGVDINNIAGGVSLEDFNGDGFIDIFTTGYGLDDPAFLFLNDGAGGFVDHSREAGLTGLVSGLNTLHADFDNDGHPDVLILRGAWLGDAGAHPNSLLRNNGDGTFEDVTERAGLLSRHPTQTAAWADFNLDGWLDLFIGNESGAGGGGMGNAPSGGGAGTARRSELYLNNGDGTFAEVSAKMGIDVEAYVKGVTWGDVDNDGLPDLYVSILGGPNLLYMNRGGTDRSDWQFEEVGGLAGVREPIYSFPVWFWDYDNDGREDLFVASFDMRFSAGTEEVARDYLGMRLSVDKPRLYRNNGDGSFTNVTLEVGLSRVMYAMGANFGDIDNDGYPDVFIGAGAPDLRALIPNLMFLNEGGRFRDVTFDGGFGHLQKGHGIGFADLDGDGHQDVYANMGGAVEGDTSPNVLFLNPGSDNAWVTLRLEGRTANRSAIGARIRVTVTGEDGAPRTIYSTVSTGGSFGSNSLQAEIGLGRTNRIDELTITWPNRDRTTEVYRDLEVNRIYRITEGQNLVGGT